MKYFNTVGPIDPKKHYFLPHRLDWAELADFIEKQFYFILHAPRQSGKTTAIKEFVRHLNKEKKYTALYVSTERAKVAVNDVDRAVGILLDELKDRIMDTFDDKIEWLERATILQSYQNKESAVYEMLRFMAKTSSRPVIIFFDEFDVLMGDSLIALLSQFRSGYSNRPEHFPQTICLIGVRDLRDYKIKTKIQEELGVLYSPFNVKAESLVLPDFSLEDVRNLYEQHTTETGQKFTDEAIEHAYYLTQGQPWLVNALAYQACFRNVKDRSIDITKETIDHAKDELILRRDTHIDALADRLDEPRVRKIIDMILEGTDSPHAFPIDDIMYLRDLGLLKRNSKKLEIANPIYQEIIPRELTHSTQFMLHQENVWYQRADKSFDTKKMLEAFQQFYREHSAKWLEDCAYKESGPHLLMMAFLQRVINGGGRIYREYALGMKRIDIYICWREQRIVIELKMLHNNNAVTKGLEQTAQYMDIVDGTEGHLVVFDKDSRKSWDEKIYHAPETVNGKVIDVWGC